MIQTRETMLAVLKAAGPIGDFMPLPWGESCLDHRDVNRLLDYLTYDEAISPYPRLAEDIAREKWLGTKMWDEPTVMEHIKRSLDFAFEKAIDQRGISAGLMHMVMRMWAWVLMDYEMAAEENYQDYGLDYLRRFKAKYFPEEAKA